MSYYAYYINRYNVFKSSLIKYQRIIENKYEKNN